MARAYAPSMLWRDGANQVIVADLDALSAGARQHAAARLLSGSRFQPFILTLRVDGELVVESARPLAEAQGVLSERGVAAVAVVSTDRGHVVRWLRIRMRHRLGGPRVEVITDYKRVGLFRKRVEFAVPVESVVDGEGPLARRSEIQG